jgi:nucleotide-binding universal stress UspA family protein
MRDDIPLVDSVLHPTDFSDASHNAFAYALAIALLRQTELTILHVGKEKLEDVSWDRFPPVRDTLQRWGLLDKDSPRSAVYDELRVAVRKLAVRSGNPISAITRFLNQQPHDLIVLATEGKNSQSRDWLHRSQAESISRRSEAMTLFVPDGAPNGFVALADGDLDLKKILLPIDPAIDFSAAIEFARRAADIVGDDDVEITLLHVGDKMPVLPLLADDPVCRWQSLLVPGQPVDGISETAARISPDLIVMTTNGRDTLGQVIEGSTTERVLRRAPCPVLAVPAG